MTMKLKVPSWTPSQVRSTISPMPAVSDASTAASRNSGRAPTPVSRRIVVQSDLASFPSR